MKRKILISINPEHVENIINGSKKFEYRKIAAKQDISSIVIYETTPVKRIVAEAEIIDVLILSMLMVLFTYETVYIYTVIVTLIAVVIQLLIQELSSRKSKSVKKLKSNDVKIPIGFYMCTANIIIMIVTNFAIFYRWYKWRKT